MTDKFKMRDGDTMLSMVKGGEVIHFTPNMSLPHSEFVKRTTGQPSVRVVYLQSGELSSVRGGVNLPVWWPMMYSGKAGLVRRRFMSSISSIPRFTGVRCCSTRGVCGKAWIR